MKKLKKKNDDRDIDKVDENKQDDNEEQVYGYLEDEEKEEEKLKKMRMN